MGAFSFDNAQLMGINMQTAGQVLDWALFKAGRKWVMVCHGSSNGYLVIPHNNTVTVHEDGETYSISFNDAIRAVNSIVCCHPALQGNKKALGSWTPKTQCLPFMPGTDKLLYWGDLPRRIGQSFDVAFGPTGWYC